METNKKFSQALGRDTRDQIKNIFHFPRILRKNIVFDRQILIDGNISIKLFRQK